MKIHDTNKNNYLVIESNTEDVAIFLPPEQLKNWKHLGISSLGGRFYYHYQVRSKHASSYAVGIPLVFGYKGKKHFVDTLKKYKITEKEALEIYEYLKEYISKNATEEVKKTAEGGLHDN